MKSVSLPVVSFSTSLAAQESCAKTRKLVEAKIWQLKKTLEQQHGLPQLEQEAQEALESESATARKQWIAFLDECYKGQHGRGELVLLMDERFIRPIRPCRVLQLGDTPVYQQWICEVSEKAIYGKDAVALESFYLPRTPEDSDPRAKVVEVGLTETGTTEEELQELFLTEIEIPQRRYGELLEAFPSDFRPPQLAPGTSLKIDADHVGTVLPDQRLLVWLYNDGPGKRYMGIAPSLTWTPEAAETLVPVCAETISWLRKHMEQAGACDWDEDDLYMAE